MEMMASLDKPIAESNVGYQMMLKMGWKKAGLGRKEEGKNSVLLLLDYAVL
tara:strand:- start:21 stop:173 length:153 start_codon:yes stop_codon:yes gene_type:complete